MAILRTAILVLCVSGCSLLFADRPKARSAGKQSCTDNYALPIMDLLFGGALGGAAIGVSASADRSALSGLVDLQAAILGAVAVTEGFSALYGYSTVGDCRDAMRATEPAR